MNVAMRNALEALERGSCVEVYVGQSCMVLDPQLVGFDRTGHPIMLAVERSNERAAPLARWILLSLDRPLRVDVSGYLSDGLRRGFEHTAGQFAQIASSAA
jgi:hypothetical protein